MVVRPDELVATLRARATARREEEAARAAALRRRLRRELGVLQSAGVVQRAWLVGSLAWGPHGAHSDVDVVVEGLEPQRHAEVWDSLTAALSAPVDLLRLEDLPPAFVARVRSEGVAVDDV